MRRLFPAFRSLAAALLPALLPAALLAVACDSRGPAAPEAGSLADAADADAADAAASDATATDGTATGDTAASDTAATPDAGAEVKPAPIQPFLAPPPGLYDCTSQGLPPTRRAVAPLGCVLDPACPHRLVIGHRSAGGEFARIAPENSRAGIRAARWLGLDGVEIDVRHTKDDRLVLMHDAEVDRTTHGKGKVSDLTLAEVTALPLLVTATEGTGLPYPGQQGCETVPTIEEAFALTKDHLFVDLDTKTDRVDLVVQAIAKAGLYDQVFVSVKDAKLAQKARQLDPKIRVQVRPDDQKEFDQTLALFPDRAPEIVEVEPGWLTKLAPQVAKLGGATFVNGFGVDMATFGFGRAGEPVDGGAYLQFYLDGARIVQSEFPAAVLQALGRTPTW